MIIALGFNCKQSFYEYGARPEFTDSIKRARLQVEAGYEDNLHGTTPTGAIFALKNMEWADKITNENINRDATGISDAELADIAAGSS
jgi:hypothetical protein